jgi:2-amino-4-hydroxy-6-hydroxymethyldihydropteridine diphosphokinase
MNQKRKVAIGLGSNLGDRMAYIRQAIERLAQDCLEEIQVSSIYQSEPWGLKEQPPFLNAVAVGISEWKPAALVNYLKTTEVELGRKKTIHLGPREIDLDLLLCGDEVLADPASTVPHRGIIERDFVLIPLCEVWPDAVHPLSKKTIRELLNEFQSKEPETSRYFAPPPRGIMTQ